MAEVAAHSTHGLVVCRGEHAVADEGGHMGTGRAALSQHQAGQLAVAAPLGRGFSARHCRMYLTTKLKAWP